MILMVYIIVDNVISIDFIIGLGTFDLLTAGIAAQRSVRNEVICTTALSYNNYTLELLQDSRQTYAQEKNEQAWNTNIDELERVDEYNAYYCTFFGTYQATVRDVMRDQSLTLVEQNLVTATISSSNVNESDIIDSILFEKAFDENTASALTMSGNVSDYNTSDITLSIIVELPAIEMSEKDEIYCYWQISYLEFYWTFDYDGPFGGDVITSVLYHVETKAEDEDAEWTVGGIEFNKYGAGGNGIRYSSQTNNVQWDSITRYIRINFTKFQYWQDTYFLRELKFYGSADSDCISCDEVEFYFWDFDATETYIELCPYVTPVHGIMYRGFVRDWLTDELISGHAPFIKSIRSISLSAFAIIFVAVLVLLLIYLLGFIIEYMLIKANLERENPYAAVPLVYCENDQYYNDEYHNIDASLGKRYTYDNETIWFGNSGVKTVIENFARTNINANENETRNETANDVAMKTIQISDQSAEELVFSSNKNDDRTTNTNGINGEQNGNVDPEGGDENQTENEKVQVMYKVELQALTSISASNASGSNFHE